MKKLSKRKLFLLTACLCSAVLNHGFAKEAGESMDVYGGEEFVITATKTPLEEKKVPMAVEVVTQEKIKDLGATNVLNALSLTENLNLSTSGMTGNQVQIRGMSTNHTLILVDGKRMAGEDTSVT
ncbi:MAG: TonB-dependent receptor plug domain-containing protein, partial [Phascolarctobacterium sp.]